MNNMANDLETHVTGLLDSIGMPQIPGYHYCRRAIIIMVKNPKTLTLFVYHRIAKQYHTTMRCVKKEIRQAIDLTCMFTGAELLSEYFLSVREGKRASPANREFIAAMAEIVQQKMKNLRG